MSAAMLAETRVWQISARRTLSLDQPRLMGVLNVTPDSFSDGGKHRRPSEAVGHALRMEEEGADIIDVGGESTRPGAATISPDEQIARTIPIIQQLRRASSVLISIDTASSVTAQAALDAGADIINDVSAGRDDAPMLALAAARGCGLILMHRLRPPREDSFSDQYAAPPRYDDVVEEIVQFLHERAGIAEAAGIDRAAIVVDPGLGFGKTVDQNYQLIAQTPRLTALGYPVLCAASRKSFIGAATGVSDPARRVIGSTAVSVAMWLAGARLFRVHDVAAHREALAVAAGISAAQRIAQPS